MKYNHNRRTYEFLIERTKFILAQGEVFKMIMKMEWNWVFCGVELGEWLVSPLTNTSMSGSIPVAPHKYNGVRYQVQSPVLSILYLAHFITGF